MPLSAARLAPVWSGTDDGMSEQSDETSQKQTGHLDDAAEEAQESSTTEGAAAAGDYDPAQGSPGGGHPVGETFPDESAKSGEEGHPRS